MKLEEAIEALRHDLEDETAPYLWSDAFLVRALAEGEIEAARRAHLLLDSVTPEICTIYLVPNKATYELDKRIIRIDRAKLASRTIPLAKMFRRDLDGGAPGWDTATGPVTGYCQDFSTGFFRPVRIPTVADVVTLTVIREPLTPLTLDDMQTEFEIPARYHESLLNWPKYRAFSKPDSEQKNDELAALHLVAFESEFGARSSAKNEAWENTHHGEDDMEGLS